MGSLVSTISSLVRWEVWLSGSVISICRPGLVLHTRSLMSDLADLLIGPTTFCSCSRTLLVTITFHFSSPQRCSPFTIKLNDDWHTDMLSMTRSLADWFAEAKRIFPFFSSFRPFSDSNIEVQYERERACSKSVHAPSYMDSWTGVRGAFGPSDFFLPRNASSRLSRKRHRSLAAKK